ncbi:MAG: hypothetical protein ACT4P0_13265 [Panacagrimonas sp.]
MSIVVFESVIIHDELAERSRLQLLRPGFEVGNPVIAEFDSPERQQRFQTQFDELASEKIPADPLFDDGLQLRSDRVHVRSAAE